jgi:hypothetical protein
MPAHQMLSKRFLVCLIASICVLSGCADSQYTFFTAARASSCSSGGTGLGTIYHYQFLTFPASSGVFYRPWIFGHLFFIKNVLF